MNKVQKGETVFDNEYEAKNLYYITKSKCIYGGEWKVVGRSHFDLVSISIGS